MFYLRWLDAMRCLLRRPTRATPARRGRWKPDLESLEERTVPSFLAPADLETDTEPVTVAVGDVNADGKLDMVTPNFRGQSVSVFLGNGDGSFQTAVNSPAGPVVSVEVSEFNGDGKPDLVIATLGEYPFFPDSSVSVLLGNGDGTFQAPYRVANSGFPVAGDLNGDGNTDLAVAMLNFSDHHIGVLLGNGDGTFRPGGMFESFGAPIEPTLGDLNGDGALDLVAVSVSPDKLLVLLNDGNGAFGPVQHVAAGRSPNSVALADFNHDGALDIAATNDISYLTSYRSTVSILLGKGDGSFGSVVQYVLGPILSKPQMVVTADFNGDGNLDIAALVRDVPPTYTPVVSVLLGAGDGTFRAAVHHTLAPYTTFIAAADFNGDGLADLATAISEFQNGKVVIHVNDGIWPDPGPGVVVPP
ncbi:MAG: VCBS repeat-containing protein, partial [Gemmataceae bacterium]|nr:VCBS repeat-containing protein [Gemmataceae bacterium]